MQSAASACDQAGTDAQTALYCLQQCMEQAAVGAQPEGAATAQRAPLFESGAAADVLPGGFYLHVTGDPDRALDLRRVCGALGIAPGHC
jgi:hypothetical protein